MTADELRAFRNRLGLSQSRLAVKLGIAANTVARLETEAFLSCFTGHLRELLPEAVYLRVYTRPLEAPEQRLTAEMDTASWTYPIDETLIAQRPSEWGEACARGLALLAYDAWEG